jgi:hypothetical protein
MSHVWSINKGRSPAKKKVKGFCVLEGGMKKGSKQALSHGTISRCDANPAAVLRPRDSVCHRAGRSLHRRLCGVQPATKASLPLRCPTVKEKKHLLCCAAPSATASHLPFLLRLLHLPSSVQGSGREVTRMPRPHVTFCSARAERA